MSTYISTHNINHIKYKCSPHYENCVVSYKNHYRNLYQCHLKDAHSAPLHTDTKSLNY